MSRISFVAVLTGILLAGAASASRPPSGHFLSHLQATGRRVALSFDDGPAPAYADSLLAELASRHIHATFFVVGEEVEWHLDVLAKLLAAGHDIENHTWSHPQLDTVSAAGITRELARCDSLLDSLGVQHERIMRPPYGVIDGALRAVLRRTHRAAILWDVDPDDDPYPVQSIHDEVTTLLKQVHPGAIVLLHPWYDENVVTRAALPAMLDSLSLRGYRVGTIRELSHVRHARWNEYVP